MSEPIVSYILQDRRGYLWFATWGGLEKFDGYSFTSYKNEPGNPNSINSSNVQALCEDKEGNLWIGTSLCLEKLDRTTGKFAHLFPHPMGETL